MSQQLTSPWKNLPPMTTGRLWFAAVVLNGKLYAVGGSGGQDVTIESYDINEARWTQAPARMSQERCYFAAATIGNFIYVAGGNDGVGSGLDLDSFEAFDVDSGLSITLNSMSTKHCGCAAVAVGDEFIVFGGLDDYRCLNTAESFNKKTERWEDLPPMNNQRCYCAAAVIKNKIYVVGGHDRTGSELDTVEVFDLTTRMWTLLPQRMKTRRWGCAAAVMGNFLVVAGGYDGTSRLKSVEMYNVEAERWTELPPMATERSGCAAVSMGGSIYVMGGCRDVEEFQFSADRTSLDSVEEIQFSNDIVKRMLVDWSEESWRNAVAPILHRRTSIVHEMDVDTRSMPTLLSRVGAERRVQTVFDIVRGEMSLFENKSIPNK